MLFFYVLGCVLSFQGRCVGVYFVIIIIVIIIIIIIIVIDIVCILIVMVCLIILVIMNCIILIMFHYVLLYGSIVIYSICFVKLYCWYSYDCC